MWRTLHVPVQYIYMLFEVCHIIKTIIKHFEFLFSSLFKNLIFLYIKFPDTQCIITLNCVNFFIKFQTIVNYFRQYTCYFIRIRQDFGDFFYFEIIKLSADNLSNCLHLNRLITVAKR